MTERENLIQLAKDAAKKVPTAYAEGNPTTVIRNALIEANGGTSKIDYKRMRDGKCDGLFSLIEELIEATTYEDFENSEIFNFVDYKNGKYGDKPVFDIEDNSVFSVDVVAEGTQGIRRQRIIDGKQITLTPTIKAIKAYEHWARLLAGRVDWLTVVKKTAEARRRSLNADVLNAFKGLYSNVAAPYQVSGTYSEDGLLTLVERVEAATGRTAKILGTRSALRKIPMSVVGETVKNDYYEFGYSGSFNGVPCFRLVNAYTPNTTNFILNDTDIYVVAGEQKFIKHYTEGETTVISRGFEFNEDLTQDYTIFEKTATAVTLADKVGVYRITG